jgi:two-component system sensor histidine kinase BarA
MSHEIRTPMNGMLVMAELLTSAAIPERERRYADIIVRSGQSLLAIVNDILDFSKIESGKLELECIPTDIRTLVETVMTLFGERAQSKGVDLAAFVSREIAQNVLGDPVRITQILSNLVNNALKFTESGYVLITVAAAPDRPDVLQVSVSDTGIGIPAEKLESIFSAFTQVEESTTRRYGGTGLGLSICQRLAEAMGGDIRVESTLGQGSTFAVRLPLRADPATPDRTPFNSLPEQRRVILSVAGEATRQVLLRSLAEAGFLPEIHNPGADVSASGHWIMDATTIATIGRPPETARSRVLALAPAGDPSASVVLEQGLADCVLQRPLGGSSWATVLQRLSEGVSLDDAPSQSVASDPVPLLSGARVLVADDSPVNREVARAALARLGITATCVENGREACEAVADTRWDLVFMDGSMPELDGFAATGQIRAREARMGHARTPIIAMTAHVIGTDADSWREAGMDGVLHKPFTLAQLAACLETWLPVGTHAGFSAPEGASAPEDECERPGPAQDALLDPEIAAQLEMMAGLSDGTFIDQVLDLYAKHAPEALAELETAVGVQNLEEIGRLAHSLKAMSLNIGASSVAALMGAMEKGARMNHACPSAADMAAAKHLLASTISAIRARFARPDTGTPDASAA